MSVLHGKQVCIGQTVFSGNA